LKDEIENKSIFYKKNQEKNKKKRIKTEVEILINKSMPLKF
jgi:uncharacterized C2H2 Zn-finger protein